MLNYFEALRDFSFASIALRIALAFICGGLIGMEREVKRRPAGLRTHILICLGASMTTLTSHYLGMVMHYPTDLGRLGAQVVAGIGFIGAGTIIVTRRQRVKGLTTAAGLWVSAIVGLCLGAGFYEGALIATALILVAELLFSRLEYRFMNRAPEVNFFIEYTDRACLGRMLDLFQAQRVKVSHMEITRSAGSDGHNACVIFTLRLNKSCSGGELLTKLQTLEGLLTVEEL